MSFIAAAKSKKGVTYIANTASAHMAASAMAQ
jgi:hypothetical protein